MNVATLMAKLAGIRKAVEDVLNENVSRNRSQGETRLSIKTLLTLCIAHLLCASALAQTAGQTVQGHLDVLDESNRTLVYKLPLSPGVWSVQHVGVRNSSGSGNSRIKDVRLLLVEDGALKQAIEVTAKIDSAPTRWNDEPCRIEPVLHKNSYGTKLWTQKCLTVVPSTFLQLNNEPTRVTLDVLGKQKVKHDFNAITSIYTRYGDYGKFLVIKNYFFPSTYGLDNPVVGLMNASPYHPSQIEVHPEKKQFVDSLVKYMEAVVPAYDRAYEGKDAPKLSALVYLEPKDAPAGSVQAPASKASKLEMLQKALDAAVLSPAEYEAKRQKILAE
jgi:hypothetical protein